MYKTMVGTIYYVGIEVDISAFIKACPMYQRYKKQRKKYEKIPGETVTMKTWESICLDRLSSYTVTAKSGTDRTPLL